MLCGCTLWSMERGSNLLLGAMAMLAGLTVFVWITADPGGSPPAESQADKPAEEKRKQEKPAPTGDAAVGPLPLHRRGLGTAALERRGILSAAERPVEVVAQRGLRVSERGLAERHLYAEAARQSPHDVGLSLGV